MIQAAALGLVAHKRHPIALMHSRAGRDS